MRKLIFVTLALFAGAALADNAVIQGQSLNVKERLKVMELINITAEKKQVADLEPLDAELRAILDEAILLEETSEESPEIEE